jgi:hypothetical protein
VKITTRMLQSGLALLLAAPFCVAMPAHADSVTGNVANGYARLAFALPSGAQVKATATGGVLAIAFDRKTDIDPAAVASAMPRLISSGHADADGKTLRFTLSQPVRLHVSQAGARAVVDLADRNFNGAMPDLVLPPPPAPKPIDEASLPQVKLRAGSYAHFTRLVFDWPKDVPYTVFPGAGKMTVRFSALARPDLSVIARFPPPWVKNAAWHIEGKGIVVEFDTDSDSGYHDFRDGSHVVIDILAPKTDAAAYTPPGDGKPQVTPIPSGASNAQVAAIAQTVAQLNAKPGDPKPADTKTSDAKAPDAKASDAKPADPKAAKTADIKPDTKADTKIAAATPAAKPAETKAAPAKPAPKTAEAKVAVATPTKPVDPKTPPAKPEPKPADAKPQEPQPATGPPKPLMPQAAATPLAAPTPDQPGMTADGQRTRDGAVLNFKGAGGHGAAVFVRGLTAWIVLEDAPPFDAKALEAELSGYAAGLEASSSNGLSILRVALKMPAAIAARGHGPVLQVVLAPQVPDQPIPIGFARNQLDPARASLSTLLPAADKSFVLLDPASGDQLTIIPAAPGRAMPQERDYAEFATLPTASGLVITPFIDDLSVTVADSRVTIGRNGGLALTPPQMPVAQSPAALAHPGDGPSYLDLPAWAGLRGGSFLATERGMMQSIAHLPPAKAGPARLELARFYLANGFAAEALGLLNVVQAHDPGLAGDAQLTTMRAAANYLMGRYRDAHNDLAGPQFDADRHAALWRGLIDAKLEDWKNAHAHLEQAYPIINRYAPDWQARAHLADTEAGLGMGRLDLADAAMTRIPKNLSPRFALEAELAEARVMAVESRYRAAAPHFAALENSGQEDLAAQAIFYQTGAALSAGAVTPQQAIDALEKLRFRWRGDSLEMKTLRKLASLYFGLGQWRNGLKSLRVAQQNFSGDVSRNALDDMRAAFVNLYLKGAADKLKPVEALAMFYDNIDLTPIGPDGDEMIRRMSDRLVAVDLLGPAATLLAYQVEKRLDGVAKAQVSARLAAVYLMDHKPDLAVKAIRDSQITGLPDSDMHDRVLLEARAFAGLKQWDNALDLIAVDTTPESRRLRADIYWESGNWAIAGQKSEELLDTAWSDPAPLRDDQRSEALRAAVAYSLANDEASLARIRARFAPKMKGTADGNLFAVLSADIDAHGLAFRNAAAQIAQIDTLETFMKDFSKRHEMVATN